MVNGNYVLYGDRPSSESEIVDDHVQTRTAERKEKKKFHRTANEHHGAVNAQLDNETDSVKFEKKIKEPRLLRYVPTTDVEENFVTEKFETYDMKPSEERPRRYAFTKKPKNPTDGSVNYAYSRSNSNSPNLPTISEHGEQYGTYRVRTMPTHKEDDLPLPPYESKLDKYFVKPRESKKFKSKITYHGSHPDSLYRVPNSSGTEGGKMSRVMRALRWPAALLIVCAALAVFVYLLMPDTMDTGTEMLNSTYWETPAANQLPQASESTSKSPTRKTTTIPTSKSTKSGTTKKPLEIDFYDADTERNYDLVAIIDSITDKKHHRVIPIAPVYPSHLEPEVQYGNEETDKEKQRSSFNNKNKLSEETTLKPHITQKPEKPLAIYFKDAVPTNLYPETINRAETVNDFNPYEKAKPVEQPKLYTEQTKRYPEQHKSYPESPKRYPSLHRHYPTQYKVKEETEPLPYIPPGATEFNPPRALNDAKFTSGHSKIFGVGIEDIEKMQSTTQSSVYNTRVSPTLPTWRDRDDSTTKNYPVNLSIDVPQCRSPRLALCRGVLPYDLAGPSPSIAGSDISSFLTEMEYVVSTNCSERVRLFVCSLLEPECNPPPFPPKRPCYSLCKAVMDTCESYIPHTIGPAFNCKQYESENCMQARSPCFRREMTCGDGTCIPRDWICDGSKDCPGGEDEKNCSPCEKNEYQCASGGCMQKSWVCDGYLDCPDGDDEKDETCVQFGITPATPTAEGGGAEPGEPGEEGAGSAPAPAVRRPNTLPGREGRQRSSSRTAADDSSKELLITSDSSNALKRNFTRRPPSHTRLTPYKPRVPRPLSSREEDIIEEKLTKTAKQDKLKIIPKPTTTVKPADTATKESAEEFTPMGLLDDFEKAMTEAKKITDSVSSNGKKKKNFANDENITKQVQATPIKVVNNSESRYDVVLNGANMMREYNDLRNKPGLPSRSSEVRLEEEESLREREAKSGRGSPCPAGELRCVDGLCITLAQLCDGTIDCSDHADEDNCYT